MNLIEEKRDRAAAHAAMYKRKMAKAYNSRVCPRIFQVGDLVLRKVEATRPVGKLDPNWEGPYKIVEILRAYRLRHLDGREVPQTWNATNLKKYYQ